MADFPVKWYSSRMEGAPRPGFVNSEVAGSNSSGSFLSILKACLVTGFGDRTIPAMTYDAESGEAVIDFGSKHNHLPHQVVEIAGADQAEYNGQWRVTTVTENTMRVAIYGVPSGNATGNSLTIRTPSAGWQVLFEDSAGRAVFKPDNANGSDCVLYVDDTVVPEGASASRYHYHAFLAGATGANSIDDLENRFHNPNMESHFSYYVGYASEDVDDAVRDWNLVADGKTAYFHTNDFMEKNGQTQMIGFGEFSGLREPPYRNFFLALNEPHTDTTDNDQFSRFEDESTVAKCIANGLDKDEFGAMFRPDFLRPISGSYGAKELYDTPTTIIGPAPLLSVHENLTGYYFYVGFYRGIFESVMGSNVPDHGVIESESDGRLYLLLTFSPLGLRDGLRYHKQSIRYFFDITGPWRD